MSKQILWIFSILQYIAYGEYVFPYFFNTDSFCLEKGGFCSFFKLYNNFIGYSGTFYVPVTIKTNFISKYKYSVCLFHFAAFILFTNIVNYILFYNVLENEELRLQLSVQKEQIEFQRNKYEQLGAAYKNIRSFMHDTKKHLFYIENCVSEKKYDDIIPYSKQIMHDLESRYCTINTGNLVVDAFVSNLLLQVKTQGITLHTNLKFDNLTIPVNDYHLTIILGNLLDNALNACNGQIGAQIKVAIRTVDGTFTIHVANTYVIADSQNHLMILTKLILFTDMV